MVQKQSYPQQGKLINLEELVDPDFEKKQALSEIERTRIDQ